MSNRSSQEELSTSSTTNTSTFLETCVLDDDHKALEEHLRTHPVEQSDLDICLLRGLRIVERKERELSDVAQALTLILLAGAKWNNDALLDDQKTPLHIICESPGDHHELLDLMIKSSQQTIINAEDIYWYTVLMCAVEGANINCLKCLIANGADVTKQIQDDRYRPSMPYKFKSLTLIMEALLMSRRGSTYPSVITSDILDLLLNAAVDQDKDHFRSYPDYITCAIIAKNVQLIKKLIKLGVPLHATAYLDHYVWAMVAMEGDVELLKCMFNYGIDKDSTDQDGVSILGHVVHRGNIEAVRYLLDLGVTIPNYSPEVHERQCESCEEIKLIIDDDSEQDKQDPCMRAIRANEVEIVKLLEKHGSKCCESFNALRRAVILGHDDIVFYLLNKYTYPLNIEYFVKKRGRYIFTLLTEQVLKCASQKNYKTAKLLLNHGADPAKVICASTDGNAFMTAIKHGHLEVVAQYIRSGVNINLKSWNCVDKRYTLPLDASFVHNQHYVFVMLFISGCSGGWFTTHRFNKFIVFAKPKLDKLMKEWKVRDNNVIPLQQRCRTVILNHLSPQADLKIENLPLPPSLIMFLSLPELDDIIDAYNKAGRS